jgi:nitroreductase
VTQVEISQAMRDRRSIRAFVPDPPDPETVRAILDEARWAPSWGNSQAWNVYVVTGAALDRVKAAYLQKSHDGEPSKPDLEMPARETWPHHVLERMNLTRPGEVWTPPPGPSIWEMYGAPYLLVFAIDDCLVPTYACLDTGLLIENVCLAAFARGLGTVIMAMAVRYPEVLREALPETEGKKFVLGVALGYPDRGVPQNEVARERAPLDETYTWVDR